MICLAVSTLPRAVYVLTVFALNIRVERGDPLNTFYYFCNVLILSNSIVDPILFFVLFGRGGVRGQNRGAQVESTAPTT